MYGVRKPFSVATYDGEYFWGSEIGLKTAIVLSQLLGYTLSKFVGIRICSETRRQQRPVRIIALIGLAEVSLVFLALIPGNWKVIPIFANGLCLGMIWGFVVAYLEGRKSSEILLAGLSCSYIVSSGIVKDVGRWFMSLGISESWVAAATGLPFLLLLLPCVYFLNQVPEPAALDVDLRGKRTTMNQEERWQFVRRFGLGLSALILVYFFVTAYRDFRDNYGQEIFIELGHGETPGIFSFTELPIAFGVMLTFSLIALVQNARLGMHSVILTQAVGILLMGAATALMQFGHISGVAWMILTGLGAYLIYVPFGSVLFDRIVASTRFTGTAVFAIYVADAIGYTGSIGVQLYKDLYAAEESRLQFLIQFTYFVCVLGIALLTISSLYFDRHSVQNSQTSSKERDEENH